MVRLSHKHIFKTQLKKITLFDQKLKRRVFEDVLCAPPPTYNIEYSGAFLSLEALEL